MPKRDRGQGVRDRDRREIEGEGKEEGNKGEGERWEGVFVPWEGRERHKDHLWIEERDM